MLALGGVHVRGAGHVGADADFLEVLGLDVGALVDESVALVSVALLPIVGQEDGAGVDVRRVSAEVVRAPHLEAELVAARFAVVVHRDLDVGVGHGLVEGRHLGFVNLLGGLAVLVGLPQFDLIRAALVEGAGDVQDFLDVGHVGGDDRLGGGRSDLHDVERLGLVAGGSVVDLLIADADTEPHVVGAGVPILADGEVLALEVLPHGSAVMLTVRQGERRQLVLLAGPLESVLAGVVSAVLLPHLELDGRVLRGLSDEHVHVGVRELVEGLLDLVVQVDGLLRVLVQVHADGLLADGGFELLHDGALLRFDAGAVLVAGFAVLGLVKDGTIRGLQGGDPVDEAGLVHDELVGLRLEGNLAVLHGVHVHGEVLAAEQVVLRRGVLSVLTVGFDGHVAALRHAADQAVRVAVAVALMRVVLVVHGDRVVQGRAGRAHDLSLRAEVSAGRDVHGFGRQSQVVRGDGGAVLGVQGGLPVDAAGVVGLGLRAGDRYLLLVGAVGLLVGDVHARAVEQLARSGVGVAADRLVRVEGDVAATLDLAFDGGLVGELLARMDGGLGDLRGDGRLHDLHGLAGDAQVVLGEQQPVLAVHLGLPVHVARRLGRDVGAVHRKARVPRALVGHVVGDGDLGAVEQLGRTVRVLVVARTVRVEHDVAAAPHLAVDDGGVVELLVDVHLLAADLRGDADAAHDGGLAFDAEFVRGERFAVRTVQLRLPVHVADVVGPDGGADHVERVLVGHVGLLVGDVHADGVEQLRGAGVRASGHRVVCGEHDVAAALHLAVDVYDVVEPVALSDLDGAHVGRQVDGRRVGFHEAALPRVVVRALERAGAVGAGEVVDEHVVAGLARFGRGDVHILRDGLRLAGVRGTERDAAAADLVRAVARGHLPFAEQLVVLVLGRLLLGVGLVLEVFRLVSGAGTGPPDANLRLGVRAETVVLAAVELAVVLGEPADGDGVHDVLIHARVLFEHDGVMGGVRRLQRGLRHLSELVDVRVLQVLLVVLILLVERDEPQPAAEQTVLRVHIIGAVRVLRGDLVRLVRGGELRCGGRHRLAQRLLGTLQIVGRRLRVGGRALLPDELEDGLLVAGEIIALRLHRRAVHPAVTLSDAGRDLILHRLTRGQHLGGDLRADRRLEVVNHLELNLAGLSGRIRCFIQILTGGIQLLCVQTLILHTQMHGTVLLGSPCNVLLLTRGDTAVRISTGSIEVHDVVKVSDGVRYASHPLLVSVEQSRVHGSLALALGVLVGRLDVGGHVEHRVVPILVG